MTNKMLQCLIDSLTQVYIHFGFTLDDIPNYDIIEHQFRISSINEELDELYEAWGIYKNKDEILDALVDLSMFLVGTSYRSNTMSLMVDSFNVSDNKPISDYNKLIEIIGKEVIELDKSYLDEDYPLIIAGMLKNILQFVPYKFEESDFIDHTIKVKQSQFKKQVGSNGKRGNFPFDLIKDQNWSL